jgi:hypothetical protein
VRAFADTRQMQQAIRRDYMEKTEDGRWRYSLAEVAERNDCSVGYVDKVRRNWGLSRNLTRGAA